MASSQDPTSATQSAPARGTWAEFFDRVRQATEASEFLRLSRRRKRMLEQPPPQFQRSVRVAVLGGATTEILLEPLLMSIEARGLGCELFEADYNVFAQEMLQPSDELLKFAPEVTLVLTTPFNIPSWPDAFDTGEQARAAAEEVADYWLGLCESYHARTGSEVILNNFHHLPYTPFGNLSARQAGDANNFISRLNLALGDRAARFVHINDIASLAAYHGVRHWHDARYWYHARQPVSFDCLGHYVRNIASIVGALYGRTLKCLALDLDNTLWGGVIGDDGLDGIHLGEGDAVGEAFKAFQSYLLELKERGILLAVCSKNEQQNALLPFQQHSEMVLKQSDLVSIKANWNPKPENLRSIATELNIGLDAIGFVDDNPVERDIVRQWTPEVTVFELSEDPVQYPRILQESGMLESVSISSEDKQRTATYRQNTQRRQLLESAGDYDNFLESLEQKAVIGPIASANLQRVTQLVNKSNQFNLTTVRMSRAQIETLLQDPAVESYTIQLVDRFGDNGLICVCWGHKDQRAFYIDQLLMSCRVLKRGVENLLCNYIVERATAAGLREVVGRYIPTAKNGMVRELYASLGFKQRAEHADGTTDWVLAVDDFTPFEVAMDVSVE